MRLAVFVSPHGYGHAARTHAVLEELVRLRPEVEPEIWTTVPDWFFERPGRPAFRHRPCTCDVGLVQRGPTVEDLAATVAALEVFWSAGVVDRLAAELAESGADAALCDISPLGLAAARRAGLPVALLENFTWDWIYEGYLATEPRLAPWIDRLATHFAAADLRIRATPACPTRAMGPLKETETKDVRLGKDQEQDQNQDQGLQLGKDKDRDEGLGKAGAAGGEVRGSGWVTVPPISRRPRAAAEAVRRRLGIAQGRTMVLVSLGGIPSSFENLERWRARDDVDFVVPGGGEAESRRGNLVLLPHRTPVHHPDLVHAADAVVGKLGYSTVAEAFAAGTRFAYLRRPAFRESAVLQRFVVGQLPSLELDPGAFASGAWVDSLDELLSRPRRPSGAPSGALAAANAIAEFLS